MKLRNKKTGEVFDALVRERGGDGSYSLIVCDIKAYEHSKNKLDATHFILDEYESLAELNEEWEDYREPKENIRTYFYIIRHAGDVVRCIHYSRYVVAHPHGDFAFVGEDGLEEIEGYKFIGNYFETEEEAEKAAEKLKAWKRLRDKGFRFTGYTDDSGDLFSCQVIRCRFDDFGKESRKDLDLLFGGEG